MSIAKLKQQIAGVPSAPGVYIFQGALRKILYIGKAGNLKNRLRSYIKSHNPRVEAMIKEAKDIKTIETDSEIEALILESQLIKKEKPSYNITMRDDKQYLYVVFTKERFPRIFTTHQPTQAKSYKLKAESYYLGPFTDATALKSTLRLLRKIFPYCTCEQLHHNYCLNYHIGRCLGYCCLKESIGQLRIANYELAKKEYGKNITAIRDILSGKKKALIKRIEKEMKAAAKEQDFEQAIALQKQLQRLQKVFENARVLQDIADRNTDDASSSVFKRLQKELSLPRPPLRIEGYDIAHIQGTHAVGAMVVFTNGMPDKSQYRKFRIRTKQSPDDIAMLKEVLERRFKNTQWPLPDIILVDGGKAQMNVSCTAISNVKFPTSKKIGVIAFTKDIKHKGSHTFVSTKKSPIALSALSPAVRNLISAIDAEAHRFAISYYRLLHRKDTQK